MELKPWTKHHGPLPPRLALEPLQKFLADSVPGEFQKQPLVGDTVESLCEIQLNTQCLTAGPYLETGQSCDNTPAAG